MLQVELFLTREEWHELDNVLTICLGCLVLIFLQGILILAFEHIVLYFFEVNGDTEARPGV